MRTNIIIYRGKAIFSKSFIKELCAIYNIRKKCDLMAKTNLAKDAGFFFRYFFSYWFVY